MFIYLMKGAEIIDPVKALIFKRYCTWNCKRKGLLDKYERHSVKRDTITP